MKIYLLGASGMLGKAIQRLGSPNVIPLSRNADVTSPAGLFMAIKAAGSAGDVILNASGKISGLAQDMFAVNTIGAYNVADVAAIRSMKVLHVSTDCVWSGRDGDEYKRHGPMSPACPDTPYGRSKLAGEVDAPHVVNVRTSFIGPDHGFLRWLLDSTGEIEAWDGAMWSGSTVDEVARNLLFMIHHGLPWASVDRNVFNLASDMTTSKGDIVRWILERKGYDLARAKRKFSPVINRAMIPSYSMQSVFSALSGPESWYLE